MMKDEPALFEKAVELEKLIHQRRLRLGKDLVWLHRDLMPLRQAVTRAPYFDFEDAPETMEVCESGYCMI